MGRGKKRKHSAVEVLSSNVELALCTRQLIALLKEASLEEASSVIAVLREHLPDLMSASVPSVGDEKPSKKAKCDKPVPCEQEPGRATIELIQPQHFLEGAVRATRAIYDGGAPFKHAVVQGLVREDALKSIREELVHEEFIEKSNDLFDLFQTQDLKSCEAPGVCALRDALYSPEFVQYMSAITGIPLRTDVVDMHGIIFQRTGNLLCHDDELHGRRVAFILYLVPPWEDADGGHLDLFSQAKDGHPHALATSLVPAWNSFAFFATTPDSYHQVREVLADKVRLSISGWFHGNDLGRVKREERVHRPLTSLSQTKTKSMSTKKWMAPCYLAASAVEQLSAMFEEESSAELPDFLSGPRFSLLADALRSATWKEVGPANRRHYSRITLLDCEGAGEPSLAVIGEALRFFTSAPFITWIKRATGLDLVEGSCEARRFIHRDYTLLTDNDFEEAATLDMTLNCSGGQWEREHGGYDAYVANGEEGELLVLENKENAFSMVYRETGSNHFVKYINTLAEHERFDLSMVFREARGLASDDDESV